MCAEAGARSAATARAPEQALPCSLVRPPSLSVLIEELKELMCRVLSTVPGTW